MGKNRAPPRSQSSVKQTALFKILKTLISQGIVEKSQSPHYSQILMVPKPDGTFRMCVDYRADASWPIPNIVEMFRRIGSQKPKIFGITDLTQGYNQAPLTLATRAYCDKQRYYLDLAKSRGRIGSFASQQCLYQLSILCK